MTNAQNPRDLYQTITDRVVASIEAGAPNFEMPWHSKAASTLPVNVLTKKAYRGVNILSLWVSQIACGFRTSTWGTYKQWQERGAQVRKGEKSSLVIFYKELEREVENRESGESETDNGAGYPTPFPTTPISGFVKPRSNMNLVVRAAAMTSPSL